MKPWKAESLLIVITFIWGGTFLFTQIGLEYCPPSLYIVFRYSIAFIISFIFFGKHLFKVNRQNLIAGLVLGVFFGLGFVFQTYGLKYTTVPKSAFITGLSVSLVPFVAWIVQRKKIGQWPIIGVTIATIGLYIFTDPDFDNLNDGDKLTLGSTIFWALYITYMDVFTKNVKKFEETSQIVMLQFVAAAPIAFITFLVQDVGDFELIWSNTLIISLAYNSILASFMLTFIHTSIQKHTTPVKAALIFALEPVLASIFALMYFGDHLEDMKIFGGTLLLVGVIVSETGDYFTKKIKSKLVSNN